MDELVKEFFEMYEKANSASDFAAIGDLYAETFLFAAPGAAARTVRKLDFLKVIPRMKNHFASLGLTGSRLSAVTTTNLDGGHALARVRWAMSLRSANGLVKHFDAFATYLLQRSDDDKLSILFQLDHQDLSAAISHERGADSIGSAS